MKTRVYISKSPHHADLVLKLKCELADFEELRELGLVAVPRVALDAK